MLYFDVRLGVKVSILTGAVAVAVECSGGADGW